MDIEKAMMSLHGSLIPNLKLETWILPGSLLCCQNYCNSKFLPSLHVIHIMNIYFCLLQIPVSFKDKAYHLSNVILMGVYTVCKPKITRAWCKSKQTSEDQSPSVGFDLCTMKGKAHTCCGPQILRMWTTPGTGPSCKGLAWKWNQETKATKRWKSPWQESPHHWLCQSY